MSYMRQGSIENPTIRPSDFWSKCSSEWTRRKEKSQRDNLEQEEMVLTTKASCKDPKPPDEGHRCDDRKGFEWCCTFLHVD